MKKIVLSAVAVLAFGFTNAQDVKFGAKAALNVATLTGDVDDASSIIGFQVGGFAEFKLSEKFAFQPELLYSVQGLKESTTETVEGYLADAKMTTKLGYINVPLMIKYYATPKFNLEFGPQIGFLLSAKGDVDYTVYVEGMAISGSDSIDFKDQASSVDFGLNFGLGYDFTEKFSAGLRYNLGLSNVYDIEGSDASAKNSVFSVAVGYKF
jgi:hypothetical protein